MNPTIAIVGRPNVGKSSIMNMLAGRKVSITDDTPGTTRDRVGAQVILASDEPQYVPDPITVELVDTGGYGVYVASGRRIDDAGKDLGALNKDIESQIAKAVHTADLVLFVIDAQAGVTALDETVAKLIRQGGMGAIDAKGRTNAPAGSKVVLVANKVDGPRWESHALEAAALGFGEPLMCSAKNNYMRRDLSERLYKIVLPVAKRLRKAAKGKAEMPEMKLAIVGKRNAGKSTLVNTLAGEQRVIVSEIAGTTRDAIDVRFTMDGRSLLAIDTAGLRRKKSFADRIEWWALERMEKAIDRADVALLMVDATEPISHVDHQVAAKLIATYKPCAIVVNKWDLVAGRPAPGGRKGEKITPEHYESYLRENLKGLWYAPISFISAKNNTNVKDTIELAFEMHQQAGERVTTGKLNRVVRSIIESRKPSSKTGLHAKVYFVAQIATNPPTIVLVVNQPVMYTPTYMRFLRKRIGEELPFGEVPVRILVRDRKRHQEIIAKRGQEAIDDREVFAQVDQPAFLDADAYFDDQPAAAPEMELAEVESPTPAGARRGGKSKPAAQTEPAAKTKAKSAEPAKRKKKSAKTIPAMPELQELEPVLAVEADPFDDQPQERKPAPFDPKKPRPAAMEAKARSRKRSKGKTAN